MPPIIRVENLSYSYEAEGRQPVQALAGVNLTVEQGEYVAVLGHNGSGKSTLAKHLNALLLPGAGDVWVNEWNTRDGLHTLDIRRTVGMVFQHPDNQIVATVVEEDVAFGPENLGVPRPEILRRVALVDPTKTKQLRKALDDLSEEGVIQVFYPEIGSNWVVGVVGQLQLEVLLSRLEAEYKVAARLEPSPWDTARWISGDDAAIKAFASINSSQLARDRDGALVFMAKSAWEVGYVQERNPEIRFSTTKER